MLAAGGMCALFEGVQSVLVSVGVSNFVYFLTYEALKDHAQRRMSVQRLGNLGNLSMGTLAGIVLVFAAVLLSFFCWSYA